MKKDLLFGHIGLEFLSPYLVLKSGIDSMQGDPKHVGKN